MTPPKPSPVKPSEPSRLKPSEPSPVKPEPSLVKPSEPSDGWPNASACPYSPNDTTGTPIAIASISTTPKVSLGISDGITNTSIAAY